MDYEQYQTWKSARATSGESVGEPTNATADAPASAAAAVPVAVADDTSAPQQQSMSPPDRSPVDTADGAAQPKYPRSFQELCEMVARGEPIPGIMQIPDKINEGTPSVPTLTPRKKPWESSG